MFKLILILLKTVELVGMVTDLLLSYFLPKDLGLLALTGEYLNKNYKSRKSTDLYVVFPGTLSLHPLGNPG